MASPEIYLITIQTVHIRTCRRQCGDHRQTVAGFDYCFQRSRLPSCICAHGNKLLHDSVSITRVVLRGNNQCLLTVNIYDVRISASRKRKR